VYRQGAVLPSGRLVSPAGTITRLANFPVAIVVSPLGNIAVVANSGQGQGGVDQGNESLQVVSIASSPYKVVQTIEDHDPGKPTFYNAGLAFSPDGRHLYATGGGNDAVYDYAVTNGRLALSHTWVSTRAHTTSYPSTVGNTTGYSRGLAVTPDGATLVVTNEQGGSVAALSTATGSITWETHLGAVGLASVYPGAVAISPDGATAWITAQGANTLNGLDVRTGLPGAVVPVGDHPVAVAITPDGNTAFVTGANDDSLSIVDLRAAPKPVLLRQLSTKLLAGEANGSTPDAVTIDAVHRLVYVANAGDDTVSVVGGGLDPASASLDPTRLKVLGAIPTAWYPTGVAMLPGARGLLVTSAKGYGGAPITRATQYDGNNMAGLLQQVLVPTASTLNAMTSTAANALTWGTRANALRRYGNPVPTEAARGQSPIKHVVVVVRENRTFDQVFGDLPALGRRDADANPAYLEFPRSANGKTVTPNAHNIASRFGLSDNFYSDGEASIQGHHWTAEGFSSDYTEKSWVHYYSARNHPYDPTFPIVYPRCGAVFQHLAAHGVSFRNFGELVGQATSQTPTAPVAPGSACATPGGAYDAQSLAAADQAYPNNLTLTSVRDTVRLDEFKKAYAPLVATDKVPSFTYLLMGNDHTDGTTPGKPTPQALVATNDQAVGGLVDYLSHTPQWSSTAVFVMEDDSQDGLDHRDGHRNILLVASPWARRGVISHVHASQASVIHTAELILGLPPISQATQYAPVPYDLFTSQLDLTPYMVEVPSYDQNAINPAAKAGTASAVPVDTGRIDVAGPVLEAQLWEATRVGAPMPKALGSQLRTRGGISAPTVDAWQSGRPCACDPTQGASPARPSGGDADG
jgi:DNA-binding beta-propeller fold protein YncE